MKTLAVIVVLLILIYLVGAYTMGTFNWWTSWTSSEVMPDQNLENMMQNQQQPVANEQQQQNMMQGNQNQMMQTMMVGMMSSGFSPNDIKVKVGQMVRFTNNDTVSHWPASGPHPQHTCFQGFDSKGPIAPGGSYEYKFDEVKTCKFHDHMNPSLFGTIIVE